MALRAHVGTIYVPNFVANLALFISYIQMRKDRKICGMFLDLEAQYIIITSEFVKVKILFKFLNSMMM